MKVTTKKIVELSEQEVSVAVADYVEKHQKVRPEKVTFYVGLSSYDEFGQHKLIGAKAE